MSRRHRNKRRRTRPLDRLDWILARQTEIADTLARMGAALEVTNHGHHWRIYLPPRFLARLIEWWPSSGKLVFDKQWRQAVVRRTWETVYDELQGLPSTRPLGC